MGLYASFTIAMVTAFMGGRPAMISAATGAMALLMVGLVRIPMAALVAVMIVVSVSTFDWGSLRALTRQPRGESMVMLATVAATVLTHDLAKGVLTGVILSALFFARKVSQLSAVTFTDAPDGTCTYRVIPIAVESL